jgi:phytoene dehydrogenase-like protein
MVFAPDMDAVERAFNPVKYGDASAEPVLEMALPTLADPALAPDGQHVLAVTAQYAPYRPPHGWSDAARADYQSSVLGSVERALPGVGAHIVGTELLVPDDIETIYGCHGGHWHHGELALDQFLFTRPVAFAAQYAPPVDDLFLCSAGAHPGGHISGRPGTLAAQAVLAARGNRSAS